MRGALGELEAAGGLTAADFGAILRETAAAPRFHTLLAKRFCRRFDSETSAWLGFGLGLRFSQFDVPTARGGTTDLILVTMPVESARKLLARSAKEGHRRLLSSIRIRLMPDEGGDPASDAAVEQWLAEPVERWGRAALCDLLVGFTDPEIEERLYADMTVGRDVLLAFEQSVDWTAFADLVAVRRRAPPAAPAAAGMPAPRST